MLKAKIDIKRYGQLLYELTCSALNEAELEKKLSGFTEFLVKKGLTGRLEQIIEEFQNYALKQQGELEVLLTMSHNLSKIEEGKIVSVLEKILRRKIILAKNVDKNILGGLVLKIGDQVFDGSIKKRLAELREEMVN